jgi:hypothetical protein
MFSPLSHVFAGFSFISSTFAVKERKISVVKIGRKMCFHLFVALVSFSFPLSLSFSFSTFVLCHFETTTMKDKKILGAFKQFCII